MESLTEYCTSGERNNASKDNLLLFLLFNWPGTNHILLYSNQEIEKAKKIFLSLQGIKPAVITTTTATEQVKPLFSSNKKFILPKIENQVKLRFEDE